MNKPLSMWILFVAVILILLVLDLGLFHKNQRDISLKESLWMSGFYILLALLFGALVWHQMGPKSFADYLTGFLIEKSLSIDNVFVISVIFSSLSIPLKHQHRVLFLGIIGVIVLRAIMIAAGVKLVNEFNWLIYIFSSFLIIIGGKIFIASDKKVDFKNNILLRWISKSSRFKNDVSHGKFFINQVEAGTGKIKIYVTPLFVALILVESADLIFAVDSIPAIFTITTDPYIIYTSNIFAILGLRSLYFVLTSMANRFQYLKYALAAILIFIGSKIFIADAMGLAKFPSLISLGVTLSLLLIGCVFSFYKSR